MNKKELTEIVCQWEDDINGVWETECGNEFELIEGTPVGNNMKYCCYCGRPLEEIRWHGNNIAL